MRIAIVNDLLLAVETLRRIVSAIPGCSVAWIARDGREAAQKCTEDKPDLILMDLIMPVMDGVAATQRIMTATPCPILLVTASVAGNSAKVFDAMGFGAIDVVCTPSLGPHGDIENGTDLARKITKIGQVTGTLPAASEPPKTAVREIPPRMTVIGVSTGGPRALAELLSGMPADFPGAIAIIQHVDEQFARGLADWLAEQCTLPVHLAAEGAVPKHGCVYLAGTNDHLVIGSDLAFHYTLEPLDSPFRPSVDVFFESVQQHWQVPGAAVLLTGIGRDGAAGLAGLKKVGWHTIAQDRATSVIYGMPKAAADLGAAIEILPLHAIAKAILAVHRTTSTGG